MTQDVRQWLEQIRVLQQQVAQLQQEREAAYASATKWRQLYETEAQQRRTDAHLSRTKIEELQAQIHQLQGVNAAAAPPGMGDETAIAQEVANLPDPEAIKQKLITVIQDRDRALQEVYRLTQALKTEQDTHAQTRKSLTAALGDAIEQLTREQKQKRPETANPNPEPK